MKIHALILCLCMIQLTQAQNTETRDLSSFRSLDASGSFDITLVRSDQNRIEIQSQQVAVKDIITQVVGGRLKVHYTKRVNRLRKKHTDITLYYNYLDNIELSASAEVMSADPLVVDQLDLDLSSGADLQLEIKTNTLEVNMSSGADMQLSGQCRYQNIDLSSGAHYKALQLQSDAADVDLSSGSLAKIRIKSKLIADSSSGATLRYLGKPAQINVHSSSGGTIKQLP